MGTCDACLPCGDYALGSSVQGALPGCQFYCRKLGKDMKSWDRWDGKEAGEWAGSQKASVIRVQ